LPLHQKALALRQKVLGEQHSYAPALAERVRKRIEVTSLIILDTEIPDNFGVDVDEAVIEALERSQARGQGFLLDSKLRKALEDHAMDTAKRYSEVEGYKREDYSKSGPFDLLCSRREEALYVEVKGTQTDGSEIILTPGEVEFARGHKGQMALFVLHSIQVGEGDDGFVLSGGERHLIMPWDVDLGTLRPVSFKYSFWRANNGSLLRRE
jgi:hypothetical protein